MGVSQEAEFITVRVGVGLVPLEEGLDLFITCGPMVKSQTDISGAG